MKVAATPSIASRISLAFQSASSTTGTDFGYLVKTASRESNFDAGAKASSSSATGLFQFIESTWLETVKTTGDRHGLGDYADDITQRSDGSYTVRDPARRREILDLRKDPTISAAMAGEFTRKNATYLEGKLGREPSDGELYAAHFLGAGGASKLIRLAESDPERAADSVFPRQARANRSIFYDDDGSARSVSDCALQSRAPARQPVADRVRDRRRRLQARAHAGCESAGDCRGSWNGRPRNGWGEQRRCARGDRQPVLSAGRNAGSF